ncbi:hypothetical protein P4O66_000284 [Electrophorus voltai]|uniref:NADH dehydrogenase [ubiquinone] 1 alpha subcomplex subunit 8 n=1 Tax=Electrophorus voltai TaxID=2609070 RepID=A0AAD9E0Y2_9TELE|nr:hypothetical protein P4O66_000284 [Electrophorus voltai]
MGSFGLRKEKCHQGSHIVGQVVFQQWVIVSASTLVSFILEGSHGRLQYANEASDKSQIILTCARSILYDPESKFGPAVPVKLHLSRCPLEQVRVSSAVLKAAAHHYGSQCDKVNKEFMLCRWEEKDPRNCLNEGKKVNECALNFFRQIKGNCAESFTEYWTCLDYSSLAELRHCRKQQKAFDNCVLEKLGWERPELGDLSKVTKVATSRPLPENPYHSRPRPEPNPIIEGPLEPAKHGSRMFFWSWRLMSTHEENTRAQGGSDFMLYCREIRKHTGEVIDHWLEEVPVSDRPSC